MAIIFIAILCFLAGVVLGPRLWVYLQRIRGGNRDSGFRLPDYLMDPGHLALCEQISETGSWAFVIDTSKFYDSDELRRLMGYGPHDPLPYT